ncbi:MAG: cytochrome c family protein [Nitrospinota bacterium]|nr:cytochrome c family protein [Nitrospinota bacterium]
MKIFSPFEILRAGALGLCFAMLGFTPGTAGAAFEPPLENSCINCHQDLAVERLSRPVTLWASSVHAEVGNTCDGCHGGDPKDPTEKSMSDGNQFYLGPKEEEVTGFCGKCHQELSEYFQQSAHWATGTQNCIQCHGTHTVQRISLEIIDPEKCGTCHGYESADKLKGVLSGLHDRFGASREKIKLIKGLPTQPLESELDKVWKQLRQVRMVSHTFDMTRIEKKAEEVKALMVTMETEIARLERIEQERKLLGWGLILLFTALAMATYLYNRTEKIIE